MSLFFYICNKHHLLLKNRQDICVLALVDFDLSLYMGSPGRDHMISDLQLPVQSVPITTNVANLNPTQERCTRYNIM